MSRYNPEYTLSHALPAENHVPFHPGVKNDRNDDRGSLSGSDDGSSYAQFPDLPKADIDLEDDSNSLTSQTLNADGTPKRPMNAFMIFARRRRPQVSAENQSMRTGDISKILSKEWIAMLPQDKQFYLDQAKQLKETFNAKYPDYVYRRRPNNSRKRGRRTDGSSLRQPENPLPSEGSEDLSGIGDLGESSPTDGEDSQADADGHYTRQGHDVSQNYGEPGKYGPSQSRTSSYPYPPSDHSYRSNGPHELRLPYIPPTDRLSHEVPSNASLASPRVSQHSLQYPYTSAHSHPHQSSMYNSEHNAGHSSWEPRVDHSRSSTVWHDRTLDPLAGSKPTSYSSPTSPGNWSSIGASIPTPPHSAPSNNFPFPTLNSPFYPSQSQLGTYTNSTSTATSHSSSSSGYHSGHLQSPSLPGREYDSRPYAPSPSTSPVNPYPPNSSREAATLLYPSRHSIVSRGLPPVQSISSYSQGHSLQPASSGSSQAAYWSRDKNDGL